MEYLYGKNLSQILHGQDMPIPYEECIRIFKEVCAALNDIHKEGILHRDISPDNIMICDDGRVKLFDFGNARFNQDIENRINAVVKVGFTPPEQYNNIDKHDERTDIYALGATMYYIMTGVKPEESTNRCEKDSLSWPENSGNDVPNHAKTVILRAMSVKPHYRFTNVNEFEDALVNGKKMLSESQEKAKRRRARTIGIMFSLILIVASLGVFNYLINQKKMAVLLPDANLNVIYAETGIKEVDDAKKKSMIEIVNKFNDEYNNVKIGVSSVKASDYEKELEKSSKRKDVITVFESTTVNSGIVGVAADMSQELSRLEGFSFYSPQLGDKQRYPVGITVPIIYFNTTIEKTPRVINNLEELNDICQKINNKFVVKKDAAKMYKSLFGDGIDTYVAADALKSFSDRKIYAYLGDSSDYFTIQKNMPGEYAIVFPNCTYSTYSYFSTWSYFNTNDKTARAASALIEYFNSKFSQDCLFIHEQNGGIPIVRESVKAFTEVYTELENINSFLIRAFKPS